MDIKHLNPNSLKKLDAEREKFLETLANLNTTINHTRSNVEYERRLIKVSQAYNILMRAMEGIETETAAIERAIGYLGEALE